MTPASKEALIDCLSTVLREGDNHLAQPLQDLITADQPPQARSLPAPQRAIPQRAIGLINPPTRNLPPPEDDAAESTPLEVFEAFLRHHLLPYLKSHDVPQFKISATYHYVTRHIELNDADLTDMPSGGTRWKSKYSHAVKKAAKAGLLLAQGDGVYALQTR